jgi:hypothetical protein
MAIQHPGGTIVNTTFTGGTRTQIADGIKDALVTAGWTVASGASGDWKLDSAVSPQSLQMRVRLWDPGSGNCAQLRIFNVTETLAPAQSVFLLPGASKTFRVVANKYQAFVWVPGSTAAREFAAFGVPYLPAHLDTVITVAGWLMGSGNTDTDTATRTSWRISLRSNAGTQAILLNADSLGTNNAGTGALKLMVQGDPQMGANNFVRWHDDSFFLYDAIVGYGMPGTNNECKARGLLWGAFIDSADRAGDATFTFNDGSGAHDFIVITNSNTEQMRGTLCVAID